MSEVRYKHFQPDLIELASLLEIKDLPNIYKPESIGIRIKCMKTGLVAVNKQKGYIRSDVDYNHELLKTGKILNIFNADKITYTTLSTIAPYFRQPLEDRKVYVVCKDFLECFSEVNFDLVQYRHLIRNSMGFVKLPYPIKDSRGFMFSGFFFYCGPKSEIVNPVYQANISRSYDVTDEVIALAYIRDDFNFFTFHCLPFPVDETISIEKTYRGVQYALGGEKPGSKADTVFVDEYFEHFKLMHNLLVYLNTGKPDLREFKNPIKYQSPTSKKLTKSSKELSRSDIVEVGFGYMKEKLQHTESWTSKPHLGWRWCGTGRSQLELVPISGSIKSWKDKSEE